MRYREFISDQQLDEVDRRGFLRALGAGAATAAGAALAPQARADVSLGGFTQHDDGSETYQQGPMKLTQRPDGSQEAEYQLAQDLVRAWRRGNVSGMSAQGPSRDAIINVLRSAQRQGVDVNSPRFKKYLQSLATR